MFRVYGLNNQIFISPLLILAITCFGLSLSTVHPTEVYYYYIGNLTLINPEKVLGRKCVGVGYRLGFSHNEGKESMGVGKYDDPSSNWSASYFSIPENPELLKTQNIPNWASSVISEKFELMRKHRQNVAR